MAQCPNKNLDEWTTLVEVHGEDISYYLWDKYNGEVPTEFYSVKTLPVSKASMQTLEQVKTAAKEMGIGIQTLQDYAKHDKDVKTKDVNGLADLVKGVVAIASGKENVALTEEVVHIATAILEQTDPKLITAMIAKIDRFKIYQQTLNEYKNIYVLSNGKPDIRKIKKEAVDKLIVELIINQSEGSTEFPELMQEENRNMIQRWWDTILDYIRGLYGKTNIDIFNQGASKIVGGNIGTVADIKTGGVYYQTNTGIDNLYDKYVDIDSRMQLNPETVDDTRHYTFDDKRVAKSVTQKIDEGKNFSKERTPAQKIDDETKRQWGDEGHKFIENYITTNLIDKDGYKKENVTLTPIVTPLKSVFQSQLGKFARELINSYPEGTRFLVERKVVNTKEKGMLASTVDFKAIYPVTKKDGTQDFKVDTLDWKFTSIDKTREEDIPWYKRKDWVPQMGEYTKIDYQYGVRPDQIGKARMIPFIINYDNLVKNDSKSGLVPASLEIGKLDSIKETNLYLLPVPTAAESTGNSEVDSLVKSLHSYYEKLYKQPRGEDKFKKDTQLNELSKAIRNLQVKLNFAPLVNIATTFLQNAKTTIDTLKKADYSSMSEEDLKAHLHDLLEYSKSAQKFSNMDEIFLSQYPKEGLDTDGKKTLFQLEQIRNNAKRMQNEILDMQRIYAVQLAVKQGITTEENQDSLLDAEAQINGFVKTWAEGTKLPSKIIKLASNLIMNAGSLVNINFNKMYSQFGNLLLPLEQEAASKGKKAFDLIGTMSDTGLHLIKKIDPKFWKEVEEAKESKDKSFFINNINRDEYRKLSKELIERNTKTIRATNFSSDAKENINIQDYRIESLVKEVSIYDPDFNGYNSFYFNILFNKSMKEEGHYSPEFEEMRKSENAYKMWQFFTNLNNKAKSLGYLEKQGSSFFPLIEATMLQKLGQSGGVLEETQDIFKGLYATKINEEQSLSKIDPETGLVRKSIPKYFTRTDKDVKQLSTDLNKIGALWIKAILDYEKSTSLEDTLQTLMAVEKAKGSLLVENGKIVFDESGHPKTNEAESKNFPILETIVDDAIYHLGQDLGSLGNIGINMLSEKVANTEEGKANFAVNTKKTLHNLDTYTRALAVGLKPLIALANWAGGQFQSYINAGGFYKFTEFEKNHIKAVVNLSTLEKALLDLIVPLNEDIATEERRKLAKKQGIGKYLSTWSFSDVMMSTNSIPEKRLQIANALSFLENSMVINGKIVNIRQYVTKSDRQTKYQLSETERREVEKTVEQRIQELKKTSSLLNVAKIENDELVMPEVSDQELAKFRVGVVEYGRKLNGQMNVDNKAGYRRDAIFSSFMMFKTWMPKLLGERISGIDKNIELDQWEYGRVRLFVKTWKQLGLLNILKMRHILNGTEEGLKILDDMLEEKRQEYYKKTGQVLEISKEEFYDLVRRELANEMKELELLLLMMGMILSAKAAVPPDEEDDKTKNAYKLMAKGINKVTDEITFYYNPVSFESMTKGSILPSLNLLTKIERVFMATAKELGDEPEKAHPLKYFFNLVPGVSQAQSEVLPYLYPELAKEMGIRVSAASRSN